jgi:hypothetical protein
MPEIIQKIKRHISAEHRMYKSRLLIFFAGFDDEN